MRFIEKVWRKRWILRSLLFSIYFNFHYLPFMQAVKLPILLYRPKLFKLKGKIIIDSLNVRFGMIQLGNYLVSIYPNSGIVYENHGGTIIFKGSCVIGNNPAISVGEKARVIIGDKFSATTTFKLVSYYKICFNDFVSIGWDCLFMDTDFHKMTKIDGGYTKGYGEIIIGKNNWFGSKCCILKRTVTPDFCTISAMSVLNRIYDFPLYTVIGTDNLIAARLTGAFRNMDDDEILYQ